MDGTCDQWDPRCAFLPDETDTECWRCENFHGYDENKKCFPCSDKNCLDCFDNKWLCAECNSGYFLTSENTCVFCVDVNCNKCVNSINVCTECVDRFYITDNGTCSPCNLACKDNCNDMTG